MRSCPRLGPTAHHWLPEPLPLGQPLFEKVVENGELGEVYLAKAHAVRRRGIPTWGVFLNEAEQGGGALIDIGTHALDMTLWIMNNYKPKRVSGSVYKKLGKGDTAGNAFGPWDNEHITVEDSAFGYITMEMVPPYFWRLVGR